MPKALKKNRLADIEQLKDDFFKLFHLGFYLKDVFQVFGLILISKGYNLIFCDRCQKPIITRLSKKRFCSRKCQVAKAMQRKREGK